MAEIAYVNTVSPDEEVEEITDQHIAECVDPNELFEILNGLVMRRDSIHDQLETARTFGTDDQAWFKRALCAYNYTKEGIRKTKHRIDQVKSESELGRLRAQLAEALRGSSQETKRLRLEHDKSVDRTFINLMRVKHPDLFSELMTQANAAAA